MATSKDDPNAVPEPVDTADTLEEAHEKGFLGAVYDETPNEEYGLEAQAAIAAKQTKPSSSSSASSSSSSGSSSGSGSSKKSSGSSSS
jgi:hypothetical protein